MREFALAETRSWGFAVGPGLWLSSLPLGSSEVPERHLSDLNWEDGEKNSERSGEKEETEGVRWSGG